MSNDTIRFIESLYEKEKSVNPKVDYVSFIAGAEAVLKDLMHRGKL